MWSIHTWSGGGGEPGRRRRPVGGILWSLPWRWPLSEWQLRCLLWRATESQNIIQVMRNWCCWSATEHRNTSPQLLTVYVCVCVCSRRLSVRAFTRLFDENHREFSQPLFTDTYLSEPLRTHAGETADHFHWWLKILFFFFKKSYLSLTKPNFSVN